VPDLQLPSSLCREQPDPGPEAIQTFLQALLLRDPAGDPPGVMFMLYVNDQHLVWQDNGLHTSETANDWPGTQAALHGYMHGIIPLVCIKAEAAACSAEVRPTFFMQFGCCYILPMSCIVVHPHIMDE
jgi:hypothetical protein